MTPEEELKRLRALCEKEDHDIQEVLGTILYGPPDPLPLWGEHVACTLAHEAASYITLLRKERQQLLTFLDNLIALSRREWSANHLRDVIGAEARKVREECSGDPYQSTPGPEPEMPF